jgi:hypothetical protein
MFPILHPHTLLNIASASRLSAIVKNKLCPFDLLSHLRGHRTISLNIRAGYGLAFGVGFVAGTMSGLEVFRPQVVRAKLWTHAKFAPGILAFGGDVIFPVK